MSGVVGTMLRLAKVQVYRMLALSNTLAAKSSWLAVFSSQTEGSMTRVLVASPVTLVDPVTDTDTCGCAGSGRRVRGAGAVTHQRGGEPSRMRAARATAWRALHVERAHPQRTS